MVSGPQRRRATWSTPGRSGQGFASDSTHGQGFGNMHAVRYSGEAILLRMGGTFRHQPITAECLHQEQRRGRNAAETPTPSDLATCTAGAEHLGSREEWLFSRTL